MNKTANLINKIKYKIQKLGIKVIKYNKYSKIKDIHKINNNNKFIIQVKNNNSYLH